MDGYGRLHDIPSKEMSRLADYFIVAGIDRDSKNGKKYTNSSQQCLPARTVAQTSHASGNFRVSYQT